ncbi:MAG: transcription termination factor NusA [Acholeplasmatales bacterium]|jgi:N utilization substance protein A|nr:transcription termination factor NusA [Acholeplasmatales bacterium]
MKVKGLNERILGIADEYSITKEQVIEVLKYAYTHACRREKCDINGTKYDVKKVEVDIDLEKEEIDCYDVFIVVDEMRKDEDVVNAQLLIDVAKQVDRKATIGSFVKVLVKPKEFGNNASQELKQRSFECALSFKKENTNAYFHENKGKVIGARVISNENGNYLLSIGNGLLQTVLTNEARLPKDNFKNGDSIFVLVQNVSIEKNNKGWPKVTVTRRGKEFVKRLLELKIPEIAEGHVEILGISRQDGERSKVGVRSNMAEIDAIGACLGTKSSRIKEINAILSGEKIDLFKWSDNEKELIKAALAPAEVIAVAEVNMTLKSAYAIVKSDKLSLAIGRTGQNVSLAVMATGWKIDIKSEEQANSDGILY